MIASDNPAPDQDQSSQGTDALFILHGCRLVISVAIPDARNGEREHCSVRGPCRSFCFTSRGSKMCLDSTYSHSHPNPAAYPDHVRHHEIGGTENPARSAHPARYQHERALIFSETLFGLWAHFPLASGTRFFREAATVTSVWKASPFTHCRRFFGLPGNGLVTGRERLRATPGLRRVGPTCRVVPRVPVA